MAAQTFSKTWDEPSSLIYSRILETYAPRTEELGQAELDAMASLKDFRKFFVEYEEHRRLQAHRYVKAMHMAYKGRKFFCTKGGRLGLGPDDASVGDSIFVFKGAEVLFWFRRQRNSET